MSKSFESWQGLSTTPRRCFREISPRLCKTLTRKYASPEFLEIHANFSSRFFTILTRIYPSPKFLGMFSTRLCTTLMCKYASLKIPGNFFTSLCTTFTRKYASPKFPGNFFTRLCTMFTRKYASPMFQEFERWLIDFDDVIYLCSDLICSPCEKKRSVQ